MKRRRVKKKVIVLFVLIIVLALLVTALLIFNKGEKDNKQTQKVIDSIEKYDYSLEKDQPKIYKDLFKQLVEVLNKEEVDEEEYAKLVAEMFAVDYYNLDNKVSKNDVGGVSFVYNGYRNNFSLKASDTVYKYVEENIYGDRKQTLPKVNKVEVTNIEKTTYSYKTIKDDSAYKVTVSLEYKKDLGYPKTVTVILVHHDIKLEVCEME